MKKKKVKQKINYSINPLIIFVVCCVLLFLIFSRTFFGPYVVGEIEIKPKNSSTFEDGSYSKSIIKKKFFYKQNKKLDKNNILARCENNLLELIYEENVFEKYGNFRGTLYCTHKRSMFYPGASVIVHGDKEKLIRWLD